MSKKRGSALGSLSSYITKPTGFASAWRNVSAQAKCRIRPQ
ncbi:MAG: hypothetical protein Q4D38_03275 [Planctomycetia bacterium]|nr:hypothetical protein [Planctomycetia bacterium]